MSKVTVAGLVNQHFFNVKSCVIATDGPPKRNSIPMTIWQGVLPKKNMTLEQCRHLLSKVKSEHDFLDRSESKSPYFSQVFQGATLNPHTLWFVRPDQKVPLNLSRPMLKTAEDAYKLCKEKKWQLKVKGPVEKEFLFGTVLSDDILPFFVRRLRLAVLPIFVHEDRYAMMTSDEILGEGFDGASDWVKRAEKIFAKGTKDEDMSAQDRLNYQHLLTVQNPVAPYVVLYNKSGTNICAGYLTLSQSQHCGDLEIRGFVAESVTYRIYTSTEEEALYLVGVLNSTVVNEAIKPYQTEGVYHGKRDIHRRPFEVCAIPTFDKDNSAHLAIATLASEARTMIERWGPEMEGGLAKVREKARDLVTEQIRKIDGLVVSILKGSKPKEPKLDKSKAESLQHTIF